MSSKSTKCYNAVFDYISTIFDLQPAEIITDFEAGMRKSINQQFPFTILRGCWFHYKRAVKKQCSKFGLNSLMSSNKIAATILEKLLNLPLLPKHLFVQGYSAIKRQAARHHISKEFNRLFRYFEAYWQVEVVFSRLVFFVHIFV